MVTIVSRRIKRGKLQLSGINNIPRVLKRTVDLLHLPLSTVHWIVGHSGLRLRAKLGHISWWHLEQPGVEQTRSAQYDVSGLQIPQNWDTASVLHIQPSPVIT